MFYRIRENKIYDCAGYKYAEDCLENGINYQEYLKDPNKYAVVNGTIQDISQTPEYIAEQLETKKREKILENAKKRDEYILSGVTYKDVLFDADTDQKINLMFAVNSMTESDTIFWLGKNNIPLECNKQDLINIGSLIANLTSYVWTIKNPSYIQQINESPDLETLNSIIIEY